MRSLMLTFFMCLFSFTAQSADSQKPKVISTEFSLSGHVLSAQIQYRLDSGVVEKKNVRISSEKFERRNLLLQLTRSHCVVFFFSNGVGVETCARLSNPGDIPALNSTWFRFPRDLFEYGSIREARLYRGKILYTIHQDSTRLDEGYVVATNTRLGSVVASHHYLRWADMLTIIDSEDGSSPAILIRMDPDMFLFGIYESINQELSYRLLTMDLANSQTFRTNKNENPVELVRISSDLQEVLERNLLRVRRFLEQQ